MSMIRIQIPATCANLGPGLFSTALALRMHNIVDVSERETGFKVRTAANEFASSDADITGFVLAALEKYFRHIERAPSGLDIFVDQAIPADSGLGSERAVELACLLGVNLLLGSPLNQDDLVQLFTKPRRDASAVIAAHHGGLISSAAANDHLIYRSLPLNISRVGIVFPHNSVEKLPFVDDAQLTIKDVRDQVRGHSLMLHALGNGDLRLLWDTLHHVDYHSAVVPRPRGYDEAFSIEQAFAKTAISVSGTGPALIVFSEDNLEEVVDAVRSALRRGTQSEVSSWIVPVDTQGVAISEIGGTVSRRPAPIPVDVERVSVD